MAVTNRPDWFNRSILRLAFASTSIGAVPRIASEYSRAWVWAITNADGTPLSATSPINTPIRLESISNTS